MRYGLETLFRCCVKSEHNDYFSWDMKDRFLDFGIRVKLFFISKLAHEKLVGLHSTTVAQVQNI